MKQSLKSEVKKNKKFLNQRKKRFYKKVYNIPTNIMNLNRIWNKFNI